MKVIAILAADKNGVIGDGPNLPWKLKDDMASFKNRTENNIVIMGRKTFQSIGRRLPNRINVVVSRSGFDGGDGVISATCIEEAIEKSKALAKVDDQSIYIIGGAQIYNEALAEGMVDEIIFTDVNVALRNLYDPAKVDLTLIHQFSMQESQRYDKDARNEYAFTISRGIKQRP